MKQFTEIDPKASLEALVTVLSKAKELSQIILVILVPRPTLILIFTPFLFSDKVKKNGYTN
jgi:hypothetical protein